MIFYGCVVLLFDGNTTFVLPIVVALSHPLPRASNEAIYKCLVMSIYSLGVKKNSRHPLNDLWWCRWCRPPCSIPNNIILNLTFWTFRNVARAINEKVNFKLCASSKFYLQKHVVIFLWSSSRYRQFVVWQGFMGGYSACVPYGIGIILVEGFTSLPIHYHWIEWTSTMYDCRAIV